MHDDGAWNVWSLLPSGRALREAAAAELSELLPGLFGYHLVSLGCFSNSLPTEASPVQHQLKLGLEPGVDLLADPADLPLTSDSVDVVVLAQLLEFHDNPHRVLREATRILIPEGHLVVTGFNPLSPWGLWRLWHSTDPRRGRRSLSPGRVKDWLNVLGFELVEERRCFFRPPLRGEAWQHRLMPLENWGRRWMPGLGGLYTLVARKKVSTLTPIRAAWTPKVIPIRPVLVEPGARSTAKELCPP
ncbi:MAG: class I SAM-dependent methyltransferase [Gammaproteobacteria bacterium]|nr:class I SAM-dependent methyltransferase [Gammaproteobacteria bacterium]